MDAWPLLPIHLRRVHELFRALLCLQKPIRIASRSETVNQKPCGFRSVQEFADYTTPAEWWRRIRHHELNSKTVEKEVL